MEFDGKYFSEFNFTKEQVRKNYDNALKDLKIAKLDKIPEVKFNYAYSAFIKAGITLLSSKMIKVRSVPGHHLKIIEMMTRILGDGSLAVLGNVMRAKRNRDFYEGGIEVTEKECKEYIEFVEKAVAAVGKNI